MNDLNTQQTTSTTPENEPMPVIDLEREEKKETKKEKESVEKKLQDLKNKAEDQVQNKTLREEVQKEIGEIEKLHQALEGTFLGIFLEGIDDRIQRVNSVINKAKEIEETETIDEAKMQRVGLKELQKQPVKEQFLNSVQQKAIDISKEETVEQTLSQDELSRYRQQVLEVVEKAKQEGDLESTTKAVERLKNGLSQLAESKERTEQAERSRERQVAVERAREKAEEKEQKIKEKSRVTEEEKEEVVDLAEQLKARLRRSEITEAGRKIIRDEELKSVLQGQRESGLDVVDNFLDQFNELTNEDILNTLERAGKEHIEEVKNQFARSAGRIRERLISENYNTQDFDEAINKVFVRLDQLADPEQAREEQQEQEAERLEHNFGGRREESGLFAFRMTEKDREQMQARPYFYIRKLLAQVHSAGGEKRILMDTLETAQRYWEDLYINHKGEIFSKDSKYTQEEKQEIYKLVKETFSNEKLFIAAYGSAGVGQSLEGRQRTRDYFDIEQMLFFDEDWRMRLFKSVYEQEDVSFLLMRLGDRVREGTNISGSLENMREFANSLLKDALSAENPNAEQRRLIENAFSGMFDNPLEKMDLIRDITGFSSGKEEDFGILEEEMEMFWSYEDWIGKNPGLDILYQDKHYWLPVHREGEEENTRDLGNPYLDEGSRMEVMMVKLEKLKGKELSEVLDKLRSVGKYRFETDKGSLEIDFEEVLEGVSDKKGAERIRNQLLETLLKIEEKKPRSERKSKQEIIRSAKQKAHVFEQFFEYCRRADMGGSLRELISIKTTARRNNWDGVESLVDDIQRTAPAGDFHTEFLDSAVFKGKKRAIEHDVKQEKFSKEVLKGRKDVSDEERDMLYEEWEQELGKEDKESERNKIKDEVDKRFSEWKKEYVLGEAAQLIGPVGQEIGARLVEEGGGWMIKMPEIGSKANMEQVLKKFNHALETWSALSKDAYAHKKVGNAGDWHGRYATTHKALEHLKEIVRMGRNKAFMEGKIGELYESLGADNYKTPPNEGKAEWYDRPFEILLGGEPLVKTRAEEGKLRSYQNWLRVAPFPIEAKETILRSLLADQLPDVDASEPIYKQWKDRLKREITYQRWKFNVLGLYETIGKKSARWAWLFLLGHLIASVNVLLSETEGIGDVDVTPFFDPLQVLK